jgi:hypothetical protein
MTSRIWIKLHLEILDDPKMGRLPDDLWRLAVELFMMAGREGSNGALPPVEEMAWTLRNSEGEVREKLCKLAEVGIVQEEEAGKWIVTNFSKRQAAMPVSERVERYRRRNNDVTDRYSSCNEGEEGVSTSSSESDSSSDSAGEGVQGEGAKLPATPIEAMVHPDLKVFFKVTGGRLPGLTQYRTVIEILRHLRKTKNLDAEGLAEYLERFWKAWTVRKRRDGRPYDPANVTWLTEWALHGTIPPGPRKAGMLHGKAVEEMVEEFLKG